MGTKAEQSQTRTQERRRRRRARAGWRRRDRALAPVVVAQRLGIPVADLARAMRAAGVQQQLTEAGEGVARVDPAAPVKAGPRFTFAIDPGGMQFFDPGTGAAIWA